MTRLALTRKPGESIVIGDKDNPVAVVTVVRTSTDRVRLVIAAHPSTPVNRTEVLERKEVAAT